MNSFNGDLFGMEIPNWFQGSWPSIVALWAALAAMLALYKDYLAIKKTKLEIEKLKTELGKTTDEQQQNPAMFRKAMELFEKVMERSDFQFSAVIKALFLCFLIIMAAVGQVWQKSQVYEMGKIVQEKTARLENLRNSNIELSNSLLQLQQSRKQNLTNTNSHQ